MIINADGYLSTVQNSYFSKLFTNPDDVIKDARKLLKNVDFDTMVGMGLSGSLVIPRLAEALGKQWFIVRKSDNSHACNKGEGRIGHKWLFVDDFIASGDTRQRVKNTIRDLSEKYNFPTEYVGTYTYQYEPTFQ